MKKVKLMLMLVSVILVCAISPVFSAYSDVEDNAEYAEGAYRLTDLGIINGYDGKFDPMSGVTRAQIAKMIVCIMDKEDTAHNRALSSRFPDVPDGHWAVPYINYATSSGILRGYADGTFGPDREVTYAELSAILLRMLKYSEDDLGHEWPKNYTSKANYLGWNQGIEISDGAVLSRALTVMIIDDALFEDVNPNVSTISGQTLLGLHGREILEDVLLMALPETDSSLAQNEMSILLEDKGSEKSDVYKERVTFKNYSSGEMFSHVVIDSDDDRIIATRKYENGEDGAKATLFATINRVVGNQIEYISESGIKGTVSLSADFTTYVDYVKNTYELTKSKFTAGTDITFYGEEYGDWDFVVVNKVNEIDPVLASKNYSEADTNLEGITINHNNLTVYRNGKTASISDIMTNDVVYYNTKTNIMDVYTKKITGIYYDAKPTKAYVESVTVGGKDYRIGTIEATTKLDASVGAYEIGDRVTLLLGKNDEVVFVSEISGFNKMDYGVVLSTGTRIKEVGDDSGTSEYIATMFMPDGNTYEYVTDKNYKSYLGKLMKISDSEEGLTLTAVSETKKFTGNVDKVARTIAGENISDELVIIQRNNNSDGEIIGAEILNFDTLNVTYISETKVKNVINANSFGDIGILYVEDLTDSAYSYGVLSWRDSKGKDEATTQLYYIYTDGKLTTYTTTYNASVALGPVMFRLENGQLTEIKALTLYESASKYEAIDETRVKINSNTYDVDTNVKIFEQTDTTQYEEKSFTDLKNAKITKISVYSNVLKKNNGVIKVIVYKTK